MGDFMEYYIDIHGTPVFSPEVSQERQDFILACLRGEPVPLTVEQRCDAIDSERDRRANSRFQFEEKWFQCREQDIVNITGAGATALSVIVSGGDWPEGFAWIAEDNSLVPMSALEVIAMGNAYTAYRRNLIFRASEMKARVRAGEAVDYLSDEAWE